MKKIVYLLMAFTLVFTTACDPMEDVYDEIGDSENIITGDVTFEMSDDDYDFLEQGYGSFSSTDDAKELIPDLLDEKYPVWGVGSLASITFKLYSPKRTEKSLIVYTVSSDDYSDLGFTYGNFSSFNDIVTFLDWKYPNPSDRVLVALKYKYYSGSVNTLKNGFIYVSGEWQFLQGFTRDEYNAMGENYDNFTSKTVAEKRIPVYLEDYLKYEDVAVGDIQPIMYNIYQTDYDDIDGDDKTDDKATYSYAFYCIFNGDAWVEYDNIINETIQFGHDGAVWVPDNTINYTLTAADYELVGNGNYGNFDVRSGKAEESVEVRLDKINTILLNNFPASEEGQKYSVDYNVYSGAAEVWNMKVILEGGAYVLQTE